MLRPCLLALSLLVITSMAEADVHDVRIHLPALSVPDVAQPVVKTFDIQPFELQRIVDLLPKAPDVYGCGYPNMPHLRFDSLTPTADLQYVDTSTVFLSTILGRPPERTYTFRLKKYLQTFVLIPDPSGRSVIYSLSDRHH